jgi:superfamily II DNA or RNA helicase
MTSMIKDYNKVLYVYPTEIIQNTVVDKLNDDSIIDPETYEVLKKFGKCSKVTMQSYKRISMLSIEAIKSEYVNYDLIIFDEAHRMMATATMKVLNLIFNIFHNFKNNCIYLSVFVLPT